MKSSDSSSKNRIIFILSLIGIAIAIYVTQSFIRKTGIYCVNSGGCEAVRKAPESYLFGFFPVPAVGLIGYAIIAICAFLNTIKLPIRYSRLPTRIMLGMSTFGVLFVTWFTYTEIFVIKGICTWCAISAVNMYVIFAISWCMYSKGMKKNLE
jgi:uncharacterized membrane protein